MALPLLFALVVLRVGLDGPLDDGMSLVTLHDLPLARLLLVHEIVQPFVILTGFEYGLVVFADVFEVFLMIVLQTLEAVVLRPATFLNFSATHIAG